MPNYYTYLVSSLPALGFDIKPPISFEHFLKTCEDLIPEKDLNIIKTTPKTAQSIHGFPQPTFKKWHTFDIALRNELVKIRAARRHADASRYLRADGYADPSITHIALNAYRSTSLLEGEMILDQERWRVLDELALGHYFDIDFLITYALKLLMLGRWEKIRTSDNKGRLVGALKKN